MLKRKVSVLSVATRLIQHSRATAPEQPANPIEWGSSEQPQLTRPSLGRQRGQATNQMQTLVFTHVAATVTICALHAGVAQQSRAGTGKVVQRPSTMLRKQQADKQGSGRYRKHVGVNTTRYIPLELA